MIINGKSFNKWDIEDISIRIDNVDYREQDTIDYKQDIAFLDCRLPKEQLQKKKDELRNDICSFANADGGYILFGISETGGVATEILGVSIENIDKFELDARNIISTIQPMAPVCSFRFISVKPEENCYIVVLHIQKGFYIPYSCINESNYSFFVRRGNGKTPMRYNEVRQMFNSGILLADQIEQFRKKRIDMCLKKEGVSSSFTTDSFLLFHAIPETAFTGENFRNVFAEYATSNFNIKQCFLTCGFFEVCPNVDGLVASNHRVKEYLQLFNNGIIEKFIGVNLHTPDGKEMDFYTQTECQKVINMIRDSLQYYNSINLSANLYMCISIFGLEGKVLWKDIDDIYEYKAVVDRDLIICPAFKFILNNSEQNLEVTKTLITHMCYSLGLRDVRKYPRIDELFDNC